MKFAYHITRTAILSSLTLLASAHAFADSPQPLFNYCTDASWQHALRLYDESDRPMMDDGFGGKTPLTNWQPRKKVIVKASFGDQGLRIQERIAGANLTEDQLSYDDMLSIDTSVNKTQQGQALQTWIKAPIESSPSTWQQEKDGYYGDTTLPDGTLDNLVSLDSPSNQQFLIILQIFSKQGKEQWGFPSQGLCDIALIKGDKVYAPAYLESKKNGLTKTFGSDFLWASHPRASATDDFKALLIEQLENSQ